jgi:methionyl-tRNA synthetase
MRNYFYITTTLPYVNADPHIGFAMEIIRADTIARLKRLLGYEVFFNTGSDEHGQKIYQKAKEKKLDPKTYCDQQVKKFHNLKEALNLSYDRFIRTTDEDHVKAAQEFWQISLKNGDIYKAKYQVKYCVGCEMEKTDSELSYGRCPIHPNYPLEIIEEENYFFRFSKYQQKLLDFYEKNKDFVKPEFRFEELKNFVKKGLKDFSISRVKEKMPWGIPVPGDNTQVMYVWFDALINYISTLGWPKNKKNFEKFWPGIQIAGKDNLRQQAAMWQAMLMSANLPPSKQIFIEGFITSGGQKISKSLGNVVDPFLMVKKYGTDALRFYLLKEIPNFDDGDFSEARMKEIYQSFLANELGNLVTRLTNLAEKDKIIFSPPKDEEVKKLLFSFEIFLDNFQFNQAVDSLWQEIKNLNKKIDEFAPWSKRIKKRKTFLEKSIEELYFIAIKLQPFLPKTAKILMENLTGQVKKITPLFPKIQ